MTDIVIVYETWLTHCVHGDPVDVAAFLLRLCIIAPQRDESCKLREGHVQSAVISALRPQTFAEHSRRWGCESNDLFTPRTSEYLTGRVVVLKLVLVRRQKPGERVPHEEKRGVCCEELPCLVGGVRGKGAEVLLGYGVRLSLPDCLHGV